MTPDPAVRSLSRHTQLGSKLSSTGGGELCTRPGPVGNREHIFHQNILSVQTTGRSTAVGAQT